MVDVYGALWCWSRFCQSGAMSFARSEISSMS